MKIPMRDLLRCLARHGLADLDSIGYYTWSPAGPGCRRSLDRLMVIPEWLAAKPQRHYAPRTAPAGRAYESLLQDFHADVVRSRYFPQMAALLHPTPWHVHVTQSGLCILARYEAIADALRGFGGAGGKRWYIEDADVAQSSWTELCWMS